ncbi:MAG: DUF4192 domain-containing protein [Actinomycetota bacterium]
MTTLTSPHDLLSAIPFVVGFKPEDSIILISIKSDSVSMAMRIDFPPSLDGDQIDLLMSHLRRDRAESVLAVFYSSQLTDATSLVIELITSAIQSNDMKLRESLVVSNQRWRSLLCNDEECCPTEGSPLPDIHQSRIAVEQVALGKPLPFENMDELVASLAPLPEDRELLKFISQIPTIDYESDPRPLQREGAEAVIDFMADFQAEGLCRDKKLIALVLVRLLDLQVRDFALGSVTEETMTHYFNAWRWLMRIAPEGYVAPVATLFAAVAYERGDGALAQRALDRVETDDPNYAMLTLFRKVFSRAWSPDNFAAMRAELHPKICESLFSGSMNA